MPDLVQYRKAYLGGRGGGVTRKRGHRGAAEERSEEGTINIPTRMAWTQEITFGSIESSTETTASKPRLLRVIPIQRIEATIQGSDQQLFVTRSSLHPRRDSPSRPFTGIPLQGSKALGRRSSWIPLPHIAIAVPRARYPRQLRPDTSLVATTNTFRLN